MSTYRMEKMFGEKLKSARIMAGISMDELSNRIGNLVTKQAISKYEANKNMPGSSVMLALAKALNVNLDYLLGEDKIVLNEIRFRKKSRIGKKELKSIEARSIDWLSRYQSIEDLLGQKRVFTNPLKNRVIRNSEDAEQSAKHLRESWELGNWALPNVLELLEEKGIKVVEVNANSNFDGLSAFVGEIPFIVLNNQYNLDLPRKRFSAMHEAAHLLLRFSNHLTEREIERMCHRFAGAFLLPEDALRIEIGKKPKSISPSVLINIKEIFGVSIQAIMARAKDLNFISEASFIRFRQWISKHNFRVNEPGDYKGIEVPTRFENLVSSALSDGIISESKAAGLLGVDIGSLRKRYFAYG